MSPSLPRLVGVVALGGALGAVVRYLVGEAFTAEVGSFPWPTFAINVLGSFLLALLPALTVVRRSDLLAPMLGSGVLGGFTTLSAYSEQTRALLDGGHQLTALVYLVGTLAACLVGVEVAGRLSSPTEQSGFAAEEGDR